jgi:hypothetical protein
MRRILLVMASELSHLTTLSIRDVGIRQCRKEESMMLEYCPVAHSMPNCMKSVQPFCNYQARELFNSGEVGDTHAQRFVGNGIAIVPPHEFEHR